MLEHGTLVRPSLSVALFWEFAGRAMPPSRRRSRRSLGPFVRDGAVRAEYALVRPTRA